MYINIFYLNSLFIFYSLKYFNTVTVFEKYLIHGIFKNIFYPRFMFIYMYLFLFYLYLVLILPPICLFFAYLLCIFIMYIYCFNLLLNSLFIFHSLFYFQRAYFCLEYIFAYFKQKYARIYIYCHIYFHFISYINFKYLIVFLYWFYSIFILNINFVPNLPVLNIYCYSILVLIILNVFLLFPFVHFKTYIFICTCMCIYVF